MISNRLFFLKLPCHGDIGYFGNWGHFKEERLNHDLIVHNGGFRIGALIFYAFHHKILGKLGLKLSSRLAEICLLLISLIGWFFLLKKLNFHLDQINYFLVCLCICYTSFSSSCVYNYSVELIGIGFLPYILLLHFSSLPLALSLAIALTLSLLFKLNLSFEVFYFFAFQSISLGNSNVLDILLGSILTIILYLFVLKSLGILSYSYHGFLAFFKRRNDGWYAWKRLFLPFARPIAIELSPVLLLCVLATINITNHNIWILIYFMVEIFGLIIQRGFFHYHYICLFPGLSLLASQNNLQFDPTLIAFILIGYSLVRFSYRKKQFWPKALVHQRLYNEAIDDIVKYSQILQAVNQSKFTWFVGWRFQFYLQYNVRPFSLFLHSLKFEMLNKKEDEIKFYPQFQPELLERLNSHTPDLIVLEENELIYLEQFEQLGFKCEFIGSVNGRISFFKCQQSKSLISGSLDQLFVKYPIQFELEFFNRIMPQYLRQCNPDDVIYLVGKNSARTNIEELVSNHGFQYEWLDPHNFKPDNIQSGKYFLVDEGRTIGLYNQIHLHVTNHFRIFKFN